MDIKAKIEELVEKIKGDKDLMAKFQKDPITTVEGLLGIDLPNDQVQKIGIRPAMQQRRSIWTSWAACWAVCSARSKKAPGEANLLRDNFMFYG